MLSRLTSDTRRSRVPFPERTVTLRLRERLAFSSLCYQHPRFRRSSGVGSTRKASGRPGARRRARRGAWRGGVVPCTIIPGSWEQGQGASWELEAGSWEQIISVRSARRYERDGHISSLPTGKRYRNRTGIVRFCMYTTGAVLWRVPDATPSAPLFRIRFYANGPLRPLTRDVLYRQYVHIRYSNFRVSSLGLIQVCPPSYT